MQSGTTLVNWLHQRGHTASSLVDLESEAAVLPPGSDGLVTLPHWYGVRFPESLARARGATLGWAPHHTDAHFHRSILEGTAMELRRILAATAFGSGVEGVHVGGGGAQSALWLSIIADVLGEPVIHDAAASSEGAMPEACARGAAMLAGAGVGVFQDVEEAWQAMGKAVEAGQQHVAPDSEAAERYTRLYSDVYVPLHDGLRPLWRPLADFRR